MGRHFFVLRAACATTNPMPFFRTLTTKTPKPVDVANKASAQKQYQLKQNIDQQSMAQGQNFMADGSGFLGSMAERQVAEWMASGGAKDLKKQGQPLEQDYHRVAAAVLTGEGTSAYNMAKSMASNNVLPPSIERRKQVQEQWDALKERMATSCDVHKQRKGGGGDSWARSPDAMQFRGEIQHLNERVKKCNEALVSDSFTFGRGTVSSGQQLLLLDVEQVLLDVGRGLVGRPKNDVERMKELENEMVKLKAQVNANFNGPRNVLKKIEEVRQEMRNLKGV